MSLNFEFSIPIGVFEKAEAEPGKHRRIGGLISTESRDRQGEIVLQKGLDFSQFVSHGWLNDNHSKKTTDIVGFPQSVTLIQKGQVLPNGAKAETNGHWMEGYLLDTAKGNEVWELANALQKSDRRLGFSIEGNVDQRKDDEQHIITKARVRNVAITNCPVQTDSRLDVLAKSLIAVEALGMEKALGVGSPTPGVAPVGPLTGSDAGQILASESLEGAEKPKKKKKKKKLSKAEAVAWLSSRLPNASSQTLERIYETSLRLKQQELL